MNNNLAILKMIPVKEDTVKNEESLCQTKIEMSLAFQFGNVSLFTSPSDHHPHLFYRHNANNLVRHHEFGS